MLCTRQIDFNLYKWHKHHHFSFWKQHISVKLRQVIVISSRNSFLLICSVNACAKYDIFSSFFVQLLKWQLTCEDHGFIWFSMSRWNEINFITICPALLVSFFYMYMPRVIVQLNNFVCTFCFCYYYYWYSLLHMSTYTSY